MGDEQDFPIQRRVLQMLDDVGDHPIAGLAVDRTEPDFRRQTSEVGQGLVDQENARLDRREPSCPVEPDDGRGARRQMSSNCRTGHLRNTKSMSTLQFKRKPARAGGHRAGFPLECLLSRAWA